jgi:hypothetical protein
MAKKPKLMSIKEFAEDGWLQEVNRQFFHPRGLALMISVNSETNDYRLDGIIDSRKDPEGMEFGWPNLVTSGEKTPAQKEQIVNAELMRHFQARLDLGFPHGIQEVPQDG